MTSRDEAPDAAAPDGVTPERAPARCPICGRPRHKDYRPFCSSRCRAVDLSRWMTGAYTIAGEREDSDEEQR